MIYSFYFEGGDMDGEVVLRDSADTIKSFPQSDAWIDLTLGEWSGSAFRWSIQKSWDPRQDKVK
jgi:hypothetical protein